ncbi:MAG: menH [Acidimicrobiales bacterium]|jgi:2-succinyl-6-hydroxy-2,4-cyclohexadiene-1-carboxylate synthase|nr:menH [Acidimicrobiales bacterium]
MARVVLVHGFTQTGRSWTAIAERLVAAGHEVRCPDAPGHGDSGDVRADLWQAADQLASAGGLAVYAGYSMGGRIALHTALAHPDLVRGLVLLGATAGIEDDAGRAARRQEDEARARDLERDGVAAFLDQWLATPLLASVPPHAAGLEDRLRNTAAGLASSLRLAGTGAQEPLWDRLPELAMPVLCLAGERDERFAALARRMAEAIGPNGSSETIAGAGHAAHLEAPAVFADRLARFVVEHG